MPDPPPLAPPPYAELAAASHFSFLHATASPAELVASAARLGLSGLGLADRNSVAGVVRAHVALKELREGHAAPEGFRLVVGARLVFADTTPDILAYPATRHGWGRLTSLLTRGNLRAAKGGCILTLADLMAHLEDLRLIVLPASSATGQGTGEEHRAPVNYTPAVDLPTLALAPPGRLEELLVRLVARAPDGVWLAATMPRHGDDARRLESLRVVAMRAGVPLIAVNEPLYATRQDRPLHDVVTAIRLGTTVMAAGRRLAANAERYLKSPAQMARLFAACPEALAETGRFIAGIAFSLDQLAYEYPHEPVPAGWEAQDWLEHLVTEAAHERYGADLPAKAQRLIADEFALIRSQVYAPYFLTVHDIVRYARSQGILCQGRGSAANSIVCFLLGVTSVDPMEHDLLFSRFISPERREPPDIDVDFEHERREEVIQYIYRRYGRERAAIAGTVIHYRPRRALDEVGKALGLTQDVTQRLTGLVWGSGGRDGALSPKRVAEAGFDPANPEIARLTDLAGRLLGTPRHLSQHVGGFVLTQGRLDETVPIHHGGMAGRSFIEWDKDDIDALGIMKVDVLALGMLTAIAKGFALMREHGLTAKSGREHDLEVDLKADDPAVYAMLCRADSVGVFQVESRAQMAMLPRLAPREFYDLVVQVAIVRPGPIQGDMVHPYLRRRCGEERVEYPSPTPPHDPDELVGVLGKTYGVPIFQEQAMRLAITAAAFTPAQANGLRRAMATFRNLGTIESYRDRLVGGMVARGYSAEFAQRCFAQIEGFGAYGFPESHAQSFARLVYVSAWMKCHYPAVFAAALLNSQPMGFYAPAQLVRDAREHGVVVRPIDAGHSHWDCTLEPGGDGLALRLGLRQITGFREGWARAIVAARTARAFADLADLARRADLPTRALHLLAEADALRCLGLDARAALWEARRVPRGELPLFAAARKADQARAPASELGTEAPTPLPAQTMGEEVAGDYHSTGLSLKAHPMALLRPVFDAEGVLPCADLRQAKAGARVKVAGVVLVRQRPGKGRAIFITLEDEGGVANIVLWASDFERMRSAVMASRLMLVEGEVQRGREGVVHVMANAVHDRTSALARLTPARLTRLGAATTAGATFGPAPAAPRPPRASHPRDVRLLPRSRDFH